MLISCILYLVLVFVSYALCKLREFFLQILLLGARLKVVSFPLFRISYIWRIRFSAMSWNTETLRPLASRLYKSTTYGLRYFLLALISLKQEFWRNMTVHLFARFKPPEFMFWINRYTSYNSVRINQWDEQFSDIFTSSQCFGFKTNASVSHLHLQGAGYIKRRISNVGPTTFVYLHPLTNGETKDAGVRKRGRWRWFTAYASPKRGPSYIYFQLILGHSGRTMRRSREEARCKLQYVRICTLKAEFIKERKIDIIAQTGLVI